VSSELRAERHEELLLLTLHHPSGLPRITRSILRELLATLDEFERARAHGGIVITGSTQAFCAGAELEEIAALTATEARAFSEMGQTVMNRVANMPRPVVAAIRGYCMGGGFDLALACHARIATEDATLAHRGATLGLITGWGGTQRLSRLIGMSRAQEIFLTGRTISAVEAQQLGIIRSVVSVEQLLPRAFEIARIAAAAKA